MKQIQITIPTEEGDEVVESLKEIVSPAQISSLKASGSSLILITVSPVRIGFILDHLNDLGIGRVKGRITVLDIQASVPRVRHRKQDKLLRRISIEELEQQVLDLAGVNFNFISFIILSSVLAAMGLITNNYVTLIASMIVAPLMGPIVALAFGAVTSSRKILKDGALTEGIGIAISIFIGLIIGLIYKFLQNEPGAFIIARGEPNIIDLIVAIASGLIAGICFVSGTSLALVGVAVAAALLPVTVNIGIAIGMFEWRIALGSLVLFVINVICVHVGCMLIFWIRKVEPPQAVKKIKAKRSLKTELIAFLIILLVVVLPIVQTSFQIVLKLRYQKITHDVTNEMLRPLDGVIFPPEKLEVTISGGIFSEYTVNITIQIMSTKPLLNDTYLMIKHEIESRANHAVSLKLNVILIQSFDLTLSILQQHCNVERQLLTILAPSKRIIHG